MIVLAPFLGYLIGSLPTANAIARLRGINLRSDGSGNPGTNNARRLGGNRMAVMVLVIELAKGASAVVVGVWLGGDLGAVLSGIGAAAGNVYNVWYGFEGGKGLAISAGVVLAAWPCAFPILVIVIAATAYATRSSGKAAIGAIGTSLFLSMIWTVFDLPNNWGITTSRLLIVLAVGFVVILSPKHIYDARHPIT